MSSNIQDSIVLITSKDSSNNRFGTGFAIFENHEALYFLTCAHVVDDIGGKDNLNVAGLHGSIVVTGIKENPDIDVYNPADLAVIKVEGLPKKPVLDLSPLQSTDDTCMTAGFQLFNKAFLIRQLQVELGRQVGLESRISGNRVKAWDLKIDGDYGLKPGYSGSPVVDNAGNVFGVVSHRQGETKGLAVSIEALAVVWPDMPFELVSNFKLEQLVARKEVNQLSSDRRQERRTRTYQRLEKEWNYYDRIVERLRANLVGMPDGLTKIQLEKEIEQQETRLKELEEELDKLESKSQ